MHLDRLALKRLALPPVVALALLAAPLAGAAGAAPTAGSAAAAGSANAGGKAGKAADLDVLFIGAHPDDESGTLATLGQWRENFGVKAGVITITRGEGGGNAVGLEEGPPLGIIREREERNAVGMAGVDRIYNLDRVDFWYTASAPVTERIWGHDDTLAQIVRVVRQTRPEIIMTMNPSPTPGNHGNHQQAARFAAEAFHAAADPKAFPEQLTREGLTPFRAAKFLRTGASGTSKKGAGCAASFAPTVPTEQVFGVWEGTRSRSGQTWGQIEAAASREYRTQGWAGNPDRPTDPAQLGCDFYTLVDSRVPYDPKDTSPEAILRGSVLPAAPGNLRTGTELYLTTDRFDVAPGETFEVSAHVRAAGQGLKSPRVALRAPDGWQVTGAGSLGDGARNQEKVARFRVTVPATATANQQRLLTATLTTRGQGTGSTDEPVRVVAGVRGTLEPLPEVGMFRDWAAGSGFPQLDTLIKPVLSLGSGAGRDVRVDLRNFGATAQSGTVTLGLPAGFTADATTKSYTNLAGGAKGAVTFRVTNTDASLPTANEGGENGDYGVTITTTSTAGSAVESGALEIVPTTVVPHAGAGQAVDGVEQNGEYPGPALNLSRIWEGDATTPQDASATGKITFTEDALKIIVHVTDDVLGKKVVPQDCKRQRRTDSVEIIVDPKGDSRDTSTAFKAGIFPVTDDPAKGDPPCFQRDADNRQGPGAQTAPGMTVVSKVSAAPYTGYTIETSIPFAVLPDAVDPARMGLDILIYDSDTQDLTSQSRLGWSTFPGVRADPYRYGLATLPGYAPPQRAASPPVFPDTAARSVHSAQTIAQSVTDGVAPAAVPRLPDRALTITDARRVAGGVRVTVRADRTGTAYLYTWDGGRDLGSREVQLRAGQSVTVTVPASAGTATSVLAAFESGGAAIAKQVTVRR